MPSPHPVVVVAGRRLVWPRAPRALGRAWMGLPSRPGCAAGVRVTGAGMCARSECEDEKEWGSRWCPSVLPMSPPLPLCPPPQSTNLPIPSPRPSPIGHTGAQWAHFLPRPQIRTYLFPSSLQGPDIQENGLVFSPAAHPHPQSEPLHPQGPTALGQARDVGRLEKPVLWGRLPGASLC